MAGSSEIFSLIGRVTLEGSEALQNQLNKVKKKAQEAAEPMKTLGGAMSKAGDSMKNFGAAASASVTAPIVGMGALAVKTFTDFDDSMRQVVATLGDGIGGSAAEAAKNTQMLRDEAARLGSETAFDASQASEAFNFLASAAWDVNDIMSGTAPILNLASAAALDLGTTASIMTDTMSQFGIEASEAGMAADVFAAASSGSNSNVQELGEAMKYVGTAAATAGMDIQQTSAILGIFANAGMKGSTGGTTLASMLSEVQKKAEAGAVAIGKTSVAVYDADGNMRGMTAIMQDIEKATQGMTDAQRDAALMQIFGVESMRGVNLILNQGTEEVKNLEAALYDSSGTASKAAAQMEGGIGGAIRNMQGSFEGLSIAIGEKLSPYIIAAAGYIDNFVSKFKEMPDSMQNTIIIVALVAAAIGPLILGLGALMASVGAIITGFAGLGGALTFLTGPVGIVIAIVAGLVAALTFAYTQSESFRNIVQTAFSTIAGVVQTGLSAAAGFIRSIWGGITSWWKQDGEMILQALTNVFNFIAPIAGVALSFVVGTVKMYWGIITGIISGAVEVIKGIISFFAAIFTGNWSAAWDAAKNILSGALQIIWGLVQLYLLGAVAKLIGVFTGKVSGLFTAFGSKVKGIWSSLVSSVTGFASRMGTAITSRVSSAVNAVKGFFSGMVSNATGRFSALQSSASSKFNAIKNSIMNPIKTARDKIKGWIDDIKGFFTKLKLKIPKFELPAMPHFSLKTKKVDVMGKSLSVPYDFDVNWYDKGGIFSSPSIIGVGEKRPELVAPLEELRKIVREESGGGGYGRLVIEVPVYMDGREVARVSAPHIDKELARRQQQDDRNRGRGTV